MADPQADQAAIAVSLASELRDTLPSIDVTSQWRELVAYLTHMIQRHGKASATLAVRQYEQARKGVDGRFTVIPSDPASLDQVSRMAGWALQPVLDGQTDQLPASLEKLMVASERLALGAGRLTIVDNVKRDKHAKGYARVTEPDPCSWCALLATRGGVYKTEASASRRKSDGQSFHDNCRCHVEPFFTAYEPPAQVRQWQQQYRDATKGFHGSTAKRNAWRRSYDSTHNVPAAPGQPQ